MSVTPCWQPALERDLPGLLELRRHLHAHPELSGEEHQTAALVAGELRSKGGKCGKRWAARVWLRTLALRKEPALVFAWIWMPCRWRSTPMCPTPPDVGVMHACGHDLHTCIGLGVARMLAVQHAETPLQRGVRLLFQPAEELATGARWMRDDGALDGLSALYGVHVFPSLAVGTVGVRSGSLTAAAGELSIEVIGEGGHGARPHQSVDAIWIASRVVTGLQEAISRRLDALHPVVVSFGRIEGGRAFNVIADRVSLLGTLRCLDGELHERLPGWIEETVKAICASFGATAEVRYRCIAPPVLNDPALTELLERCAIDELGKAQVLRLDQPSLGAEDFAELVQTIPGSMFRLGVAGPEGCAPLHNGRFCPDEASLGVGIRVLTATLLAWMGESVREPSS